MFSNLFNRSNPQDEMKRAKAAYEKVVASTSDTREARSMRLGMSLLCRAHLDKTFIAGAEKTADFQQIAAFAAAKGDPAPEMPPPSRFQKVKSGKGEVYVYLPEQYVTQAFTLGSRYQTMQISAAQAVEEMQAIANHISHYELALEKPFQALAFLRDELPGDSGDEADTPDEDAAPEV
jgi:hypothetical protein